MFNLFHLFHKHDWLETVRTYAPPTKILGGEINPLPYMGQTTILYECVSGCDSIRKEQMLGKIV